MFHGIFQCVGSPAHWRGTMAHPFDWEAIMRKVHVRVGMRVNVVLPASEVCMAMSVADEFRTVVIGETSAQILEPSGQPFSFPVLHGEAGILEDEKGLYIHEYSPEEFAGRHRDWLCKVDPPIPTCNDIVAHIRRAFKLAHRYNLKLGKGAPRMFLAAHEISVLGWRADHGISHHLGLSAPAIVTRLHNIELGHAHRIEGIQPHRSEAGIFGAIEVVPNEKEENGE